ncbi:MAG: hypothetical protein ACREIQ_03965, partial [Nitrospiria bacterium]
AVELHADPIFWPLRTGLLCIKKTRSSKTRWGLISTPHPRSPLPKRGGENTQELCPPTTAWTNISEVRED